MCMCSNILFYGKWSVSIAIVTQIVETSSMFIFKVGVSHGKLRLGSDNNLHNRLPDRC